MVDASEAYLHAALIGGAAAARSGARGASRVARNSAIEVSWPGKSAIRERARSPAKTGTEEAKRAPFSRLTELHGESLLGFQEPSRESCENESTTWTRYTAIRRCLASPQECRRAGRPLCNPHIHYADPIRVHALPPLPPSIVRDFSERLFPISPPNIAARLFALSSQQLSVGLAAPLRRELLIFALNKLSKAACTRTVSAYGLNRFDSFLGARRFHRSRSYTRD